MEQDEATGDGQRVTETADRRRRRLGAFVALAVVCAVVAGFGALARSQQRALPAGVAGWQVYHDPLGLFSMRLPPGWTAVVMMGSFTQGDRMGSDSGQDESITFRDPSQGQASASIWVYAMPIHNTTLAQRMDCSSRPREPLLFNGYPADANAPEMTLFESGNAHFQIDETIPGVLMPPNLGKANPLLPTPSPLPAATVTADRALLSDALASFQPANPKPLVCP
jgi:hypothetical protein